MGPPHNVLKYGPFLESGSVHDMILAQFVMPKFESFPSYIQLAQYAGDLLTRTYPHHFRYYLEDMRQFTKGEGETDQAYTERLRGEFARRINGHVANYA